MQIFKKSLSSLLIVIILASSAVSCQKNPPDNTTAGSESTTTRKDEEIKVLSGKIKYSPDNYNMWDSWYVVIDGTVHLIHLKGLREGGIYDSAAEAVRGYGHATSGDLIHWEEKKDILKVDPTANPYELDFRYTGSAIVKDGRCYIFYTMRKWGGQRIGMAYSDDMENWTEYKNNPILVPDPKYFISFNPQNPGTSTSAAWGDTIDCRDFVVIPDPKGGGYYGYFVASAEGEFFSPTAVIGIAYSRDLFNWEQKGIVYTPDGVNMPEMIDVFEYGGKWYMTLTTAKNNGGINMFSDPYISRAQIYAVASSPEGPFVENKEDNVLFGGQYDSGYSARTVMFDGKLRMMYVDANTGKSVLSLPKNVGVNSDGHLRLFYADDLLGKLGREALSTNIVYQPTTSFAWNTHGGKWVKNNNSFGITADKNSWQAAVFAGTAKNLELYFEVGKNSTAESFGIVLTNKDDNTLLSSLDQILVLDRKNDRIYLTGNTFELSNAKSFDFDMDTAYTVRMLLVGNTIEVYINNELAFNSGIENTGRNKAGIFANSGSMIITNLALNKLES